MFSIDLLTEQENGSRTAVTVVLVIYDMERKMFTKVLLCTHGT